MSAEQNKALARQMMDETFNRGNISKVDEYVAPDFIEHEILPPGMPSGREGVKQMIAMLHSAFPDFQTTIEDIVAEGDKVVIRQTWSGTHRGEFMGVPASGNEVNIKGMTMLTMTADGKCAEAWGVMDMMGLMQQIGALPVG